MEIKDFAICNLSCNDEEAKTFDRLVDVLDHLYDIMENSDWDLHFAHYNTVLTSTDIAKIADVIKILSDPGYHEFYLQKL